MSHITKMAFYNAHSYDRKYFDEFSKKFNVHIDYFETRLNEQTWKLIEGHEVVCIFVNDRANEAVLRELHARGVKLLALRSAGFNHVDLKCAQKLGIKVVRVPAYSPYAVAEHALGLMFSLNRKYHKAYQRVREGNFSLEGLMGFDFHGKIAGIVGTGKIGEVMISLLKGLGMKLLAYDPFPSDTCKQLGAEYVDLETIFSKSDIVTLHCPLTPETYHLVNEQSLRLMRPGSMLINTSRGGLIDTSALIQALKQERPKFVGLDVYEEEEALFFEDFSEQVIQDDVFARLLTFPNVIITGHQAFFTSNAMICIAQTTLENVQQFKTGGKLTNEVIPAM